MLAATFTVALTLRLKPVGDTESARGHRPAATCKRPKRTGNPSDVRFEKANRQWHLLRLGQLATGKCLAAGPRAV
jgi:hypothetical protein